MEDPGGFYVIGLGDREDPNTGRGPLYLEMLAGREIALPVFFSPETLERDVAPKTRSDKEFWFKRRSCTKSRVYT
jgi:hypothetical protein